MPSTLRPPPPEDTPPSTRPSSSASSASSGGPPLRTTSMDSLPTSNSEKNEHIPTRTVGAGPKLNTRAMQFVKTGPAQLYKTANEQIKKAQTVKALRKQAVREEEEPDWQQNLDKWKMSRRKRNEDALERVIEVRKFENEVGQGRRKSKTFSEMREETGKRGRRFNLVVHDDDNDDLSGLGLSTPSSGPPENENNKLLSSHPDTGSGPPPGPPITKDMLEQDNKDAKSDAGFCTGSDTGSDGVFAEDNISDTSSAMGDKKETHDSLLDAGLPPKEEDVALTSLNSSTITSSSTTRSTTSTTETVEYTYDKAIQGYKQYAENTVKKLNSSLTSLNTLTNNSTPEKDHSPSSPTKTPSATIGNKLDFFTKEMDKEFSKPTQKPLVTMREKSHKVDITKRRTMFEMGQSKSTMNLTSIDNNLDRRRSTDMTASTGNLKNKVASFENLDCESNKHKGVAAPRDSKFKDKLATFNSKEKEESSVIQRKTPEKDKNFMKKLASFSSLESAEESKIKETRSSKSVQLNSTLKSKIASFEQLDKQDQSDQFCLSSKEQTSREKSISMECLSKPQRKLEMNFSRGSTDKLDEEPTSKHSSIGTRWQSSQSVTEKSSEKSYVTQTKTESFSSSKIVSRRNSEDTFLECPPLDIQPMGVASPDAPISTSSPRSNKVSSSSSTATAQPTPMTNGSSVSSSKFSTSYSYNKSVLESEPQYDDVITSGTHSSSRSSLDNGKMKYTDDDINEVIDNLEEEQQQNSSVLPYAQKTTVINPQTIPAREPSPPRHLPPTPPKEAPPAGPSQVPPRKPSLELQRSLLPGRLDSGAVVFEEWSDKAPDMAPPSVPPPPPPCDSSSDSETEKEALRSSHLPTSPTPSDCPSLVPSENYASSEASSRTGSAREELRKRRSDFLGTSRLSDGPSSPQPDMDALIQQQQREADKKMLEARKSLQLSTAQALSDIEQSRKKIDPPVVAPVPFGAPVDPQALRGRYTWEDRLRDDTCHTGANLNDTDDGYGYQCKLAELEAEMIRHDRSVLSKTITQSTVAAPPQSQPPVGVPPVTPIYDDVEAPKSDLPPPKVNGTIPYDGPAKALSQNAPEKPQRTYNPCYDSTAPQQPEPLPRKKLPPSAEEESQYEVLEGPQKSLTKQSRHALSATPRNKLTDGESWIKRKAQPNKDYNKHWLLQEAEQRRLEQRPTPKQDKNANASAPFVNRALEPSSRSPPNRIAAPARPSVDPVNRVSDPNAWRNQATTYQPLPAPPPNATTADKPLPDAIINSLTQRVNNKSRPSSANNSSGRPSPYGGSISGSTTNLHYTSSNQSVNNNNSFTTNDEDYHDYMNAEAINQHHQQIYQNMNYSTDTQQIYANQPPVSSGPPLDPQYHVPPASQLQGIALPQPAHPSPPMAGEQNLVSVSGKKKCSHCGEELGRGAAMIIESLRLFYHIPCFVCCVCGVQLGNGEAGADVRVRNHALHCQNCYSNDKGMKFSEV